MPTVAEQFRSAREAHGLTVHQVAEITKIKTEHVRALETGDYRAFAAPVYLRGFIRTYARLLHLDPEQMISEANAEWQQTGIFAEASFSAHRHEGLVDALMLQFSKVNWRVVLPLLGVALVLVVLILSYRAWTDYRSRDPLSRLGSGQYEPPQPDPIETLPLRPK
jgi:cytoskeletal protein RodZ